MATKTSKQAKPAQTSTATKNSSAAKGNKTSNKIKPKGDAADGLRALMEDSLKDIYWAEKSLLKAIPKMIKNATSSNLIEGLKGHLETKGQVTRLEKVFELMGKKAQAKKCEAMAGLAKEAEEIMQETEPGVVRDAGIILAAQKVEHYEIATYGTLCAFAKALGEDEVGAILHETLEEEKAADEKLTDAAYNDINVEAAEAGE